MVYLIHFEKPFKHAQHYIGYTKGVLSVRMNKHRHGTGSKLMRAVTNAGIEWSVARVWKDGDQTFERSLKNRKKSKCLCPTCTAGLSKFRYRARKRKAIAQ